MDIVEQFKSYLDIERDRPITTITQYIYDLNLFRRFLKKKDLREATTGDIRSFLAHLKTNRHYQGSSLSRKASSLKTFYKFLIREFLVKENPMDRIETPKVSHPLPIYLTHEEVIQCRQCLESQAHTPRGMRNKTIFECLYNLGLRVSELVNIKFQDITDEEGKITIKILGKGNKERVILFNPSYADVLRGYLHLLKSKGVFDGYVFRNPRTGRPLTSRAVEYFIKDLARKAGIKKKVTPHKLRHTFATRLVDQGTDIVQIRDLLGHSNLSTTSIYAHATPLRQEEAVKKL